MNVDLSRSSIAELNMAVERLALASNSTAREVLPAQMRLLAVDLAAKTRPRGKGAAAKKEGEKRIETRIGAIYKPVGVAAGWLESKSPSLKSAFIRLVKKREFAKAADLLNKHTGSSYTYTVGMFDGGDLHRAQNRSSRATKAMIVIDYKKVETYIKDTKKKVGFAKGGFATAAKQLGGTRGIPGYASRHTSAPGQGSVSSAGHKTSVMMANLVKYIREALSKPDEMEALALRKSNITAVIKRMMSRKTKSASRSLK